MLANLKYVQDLKKIPQQEDKFEGRGDEGSRKPGEGGGWKSRGKARSVLRASCLEWQSHVMSTTSTTTTRQHASDGLPHNFESGLRTTSPFHVEVKLSASPF